ncbi:hypothetical protein SAMN04487905_11260 [Actinopolyspora xinjiangensis]|uniref:Uncharacterized protein n=1 Tax=Actinopolyspora xinjiangensis TaxID=405564 RepID=A0A1H0WG85_9ACTN|nr:hypothetical protein SAMN04487905_11260 [Actinopolyspora xinjiangensis]
MLRSHGAVGISLGRAAGFRKQLGNGRILRQWELFVSSMRYLTETEETVVELGVCGLADVEPH